MKYTEKYPDAVDPRKRFPEALMGPHPEVILGPGIAQTWRMYPCASCRTVTGFRLELGEDFPMAPCCSEECEAVLKADRAEIAPKVPQVVLPEVVHATCPCVDPKPLGPLDRPAAAEIVTTGVDTPPAV